MIVRIVLWSVVDDAVDLAMLRDRLPELASPSTWVWNGASERFGALVVGDDDDEVHALAEARSLLGREPDLYEEFDSLLSG